MYGNTLVKISGNGFTQDDQIKLDNSICRIVNATINEVYCLTSVHSEQEVSINFKYKI